MNSDNTGLIIGIAIVALIIIILIGVLIYYFYFRNDEEDEPIIEPTVVPTIPPAGSTVPPPGSVTPPTNPTGSGQPCNDQQKCSTGLECRQNSCISAKAPAGCYYGPFGPLSSCSEVCGGGVQSKTRMVLKPDGSQCNFPPIRETKPCNTQDCSTVPQHAGLTVEENVDYFGNDMPNMPIGPFDNANRCASSCSTTEGCQSYSWLSPNAPWVKENPESKGECYLKNKVGHRRVSAGIFGGKKVV